MKTVLSTSVSSNSTTTTAAIEDDERSEARDSCYYPGCRKDANCDCKICLESINATLDLMPYSVQKSSLTKFSSSRPNNVETTPISFNPSILTTPTTVTSRISKYPKFESPVKLGSKFKVEEGGRDSSSLRRFVTLVFVLSLILAVTTGFSCAIARVIRPKLSAEIVRTASKNSQFVQDLNGKLRVLEREFQGMVNAEISNCSYSNSYWEIDQEGMILSSKCIMYKSATETVSIWGWPLQTAGLLRTGFSQRSFTILSGRLTEWSDGGIGYLVREANTSWVQKRWGASAVQLDPNTWVLEYRQSSLLENSSLNTMAADFFKHWMRIVIRRLKNELWLFLDGEIRFHQVTATSDFKTPT
ncbi:hypothetical protein IC582_012690 [Cucumis melo]|uniref:C-8 sterol isomerase n=1 Tax=Cucumis melo var. makuwa TaxID=1194695 RepID=A0A5A7U224_CUCMM|nr:putative C-8 sterol isomerase [Cucumis melo var. makuwa]TYK17204.1 putative C-8 sterol isomerase [Cucumis melo var. makuwa]